MLKGGVELILDVFVRLIVEKNLLSLNIDFL